MSVNNEACNHNEGDCTITPRRVVVVVVLVVIVVVIQALYGSITTRQKYKGTASMNYRERGSHARGVYLTLRLSEKELN